MQWLDRIPYGVRLPVTTPLAEVEAAVEGATVLVLEFDAFRDGRGFSLAAILRERGWAGRLIAAGRLIPDQARHLRRSGFDAVVLSDGADVEAWARMDRAFSAAYQPAVDPLVPIWRRRAAAEAPQAVVERLNRQTRDADADDILRAALSPELGRKPAVLSSFGAEAAVLLAAVARIDPSTPVIFLETGMHFLQTLAYRKALTERLGLTDVRIVTPDPGERDLLDPHEDLWRADPDACCELRKVRPLERALAGINVLITGRKRYQTPERQSLRAFEVFEDRIRVNPLHDWTPDRLQAAMDAADLPRHPLSTEGYPSIGCWPCTRAVGAGEESRDGRWSGAAKTECGIHLGRRALTAV
ncbi:MAG: phosphoadenylyl-sulfate reductase [Brevundimonas sp.]|uniref:phosphoadenylyl-sulfate reductase n=1 Tax=Brevundimonas sp. TaxID=1871086 RepID=UPI0027365E1B|nr:phosphoadenylyl-sulfate reductase [Brevundimonas sp.]MDP3404135.1 phosphoadenylyl-sulfate reductase [Brevundimonas sp.]